MRRTVKEIAKEYGKGWEFEAIDKDGTITIYQITDVTVRAIQ